jgi:hypothetical protein
MTTGKPDIKSWRRNICPAARRVASPEGAASRKVIADAVKRAPAEN